jgi:hypothetical protein
MRLLVPAARRIAFLLLLAACGSRTGLYIDDYSVVTPGDLDSGVPSGSGIGFEDAATDARDGAPPPLDARPPVDVFRNDCPDSDALLVYTITKQFDLQSFNPATGQFATIGHISCPAPDKTESGDDNTPFSMAVDRTGIAYILFEDHHLYRVSAATGACIATDYEPDQSNFQLFGMGFTTIGNGPAETLYVAGDSTRGFNGQPRGASGIAAIDPTNFALRVVTPTPSVIKAELTGTGDGRLYAFYNKAAPDDPFNEPPSFIGQIDTDTGNVIGERRFESVGLHNAWAFAFWGGDFYMFHGATVDTDAPTTVTRWRPSDDSVVDVATNPDSVVGAGVSTCAPQQ